MITEKLKNLLRKIQKKYKLRKYLKAAEKGRITAHWYGKLVGFKYTRETVYTSDWDEITLTSRGIVFDSETGEIVARPFDKFFNYGELIDSETGELTELAKKVMKYQKKIDIRKILKSIRFHTMEKVDGSLGIVFWNPYLKHWQLKTGGSFDSDQAIWGQRWFDQHIKKELLNSKKTYLFEIVYNEDFHPIRYDFEGLVLLAVIDNETGEEEHITGLRVYANAWGIKMAEIYEFDTFNEARNIATKLPSNQEGYVITFPEHSFKIKVKSDEWCQLAKMLECLSEWNIWVAYDCEKDFFHANVDKTKGYKPIDDEVLYIPEEFPELREYAESVRKRVAELTEVVVSEARETMKAVEDQRSRYEYATAHYKSDVGAIMQAIKCISRNDKSFVSVKRAVHKKLEPSNVQRTIEE